MKKEIKYLRSFEELGRLCSHSMPEVREWAMQKLSALYPERAAETAALLIEDSAEPAALEAADYFIDHPDGRYNDGIIDVYKKSSGRLAGRLAGALSKSKDERLIHVFKEKYAEGPKDDIIGYSMSVFTIAELKNESARDIAWDSLNILNSGNDYYAAASNTLLDACIIAGVDMARLIKWCDEHRNEGFMLNFAVALSRRCGSWYSEKDFISEGKDSRFKASKKTLALKDSLNILKDNGYDDAFKQLKSFFKRQDYVKVVEYVFDVVSSIIAEKNVVMDGDAFRLWLENDAKPALNIRALDAVHSCISAVKRHNASMLAIAFVVIFTLLIENRNLIGVDIKKLNATDLLNLFLDEREDVEADELMADMLIASPESEDIIAACIRRLEEYPNALTNRRVVRLLKRRANEDIVRHLIKLPVDDFLWEDITDVVISTGAFAVDIAEMFINDADKDRLFYAFRMLEEAPIEKSVELILKNWQMLYDFDKDILFDTIVSIGDRRFAAPVSAVFRQGEYHESKALYMLCIINDIKDPKLDEAERFLRKEKEKRERFAQMLKESPEDIIYAPLDVQLKCRRCGNAYHYEIKRIMIDADKHDKFISDTITCKKCGALDHYEITPEGEMGITARLMLLMELDNKDALSGGGTISLIGTSKIDGKAMSMAEAVAYYEQKVRDNHGNAAHLIGYANTLCHAKRTEDAVSVYEDALVHDPKAVEAYISLGQIADDRGDLRKAYEHLKKAVELIDSGNYYKVRQNMDSFKADMLDAYMDLAKRLGIKDADLSARRFYPKQPAQPLQPVVRESKTGRNDPCPCGSGKKYKKCCLDKEIAKAQDKDMPTTERKAEHDLIARVIKHSENVPKKDFLNAVAQYYRIPPIEPLNLPERSLEDGGAFTEWYVNDYLLPSGRTIIEDFYTKNFNRLKDNEKRLLEAHMQAYESVYEVQEVVKGIGMKLKDIFTGEKFDVREVKGTYSIAKWDITKVRVYTLDGISRFAGNGRILPRRSRDGLTAYLQREFEEFKSQTGKAEWSAFMKAKSYIIEYYYEDLPDEKPSIVTAEGHRMVSAKAYFDVDDFDSVLDAMRGRADFIEDEVVEGRSARFTWIKRGQLKDWKTVGNTNGYIFATQYVDPSGQVQLDALGTVTIDKDKMTLECVSRERLQRGKERLVSIAGKYIRYKVDSFEDIDAVLDRYREAAPADAAKEISPSHRRIAEAAMNNRMMKWMDEPIPALNGMTPREAALKEESRQKLIELLKDMENMEERKRLNGELYFDMKRLREEIGL